MQEAIFSNGCRVDVSKVTGVTGMQAGDTLIRTEDGCASVFVTETHVEARRLLHAAGWRRPATPKRLRNPAESQAEDDWFDSLGEVTQPNLNPADTDTAVIL